MVAGTSLVSIFLARFPAWFKSVELPKGKTEGAAGRSGGDDIAVFRLTNYNSGTITRIYDFPSVFTGFKFYCEKLCVVRIEECYRSMTFHYYC